MKKLKAIYKHLMPRENPQNKFEESPLLAYLAFAFLIAYGSWGCYVVFFKH